MAEVYPSDISEISAYGYHPFTDYSSQMPDSVCTSGGGDNASLIVVKNDEAFSTGQCWKRCQAQGNPKV